MTLTALRIVAMLCTMGTDAVTTSESMHLQCVQWYIDCVYDAMPESTEPSALRKCIRKRLRTLSQQPGQLKELP